MTDLEKEFLGSLKALMIRYKVKIVPASKLGGDTTFMVVDTDYSANSELNVYLNMEEIISYINKA